MKSTDGFQASVLPFLDRPWTDRLNLVLQADSCNRGHGTAPNSYFMAFFDRRHIQLLLNSGLHSNSAAAKGGEGFKSAEVFDMMSAAIDAQGPKLVKTVKGVIQYVVTGGPGKKKWTWHTDLKNGDGACKDSKAKKADLTLTITGAVFIQIAEGTMKPQMAFMRGKLKIKGSMGLAMKLQGVIDVARRELGPQAKL